MNEYLFVFVMVLCIHLAFQNVDFLNPTVFFLKDQHGLLYQMLSFIPQHVQISEQPFFFL